MRNYATIISTILAALLFACHANKNRDGREVSIDGDNNQSIETSSTAELGDFYKRSERANDTVFIGIGCGIIGSYSPEILSFRRLVSLRDYAGIKEKLFSVSDLDKLLASIALTEYASKNESNLSEHERNQILTIRNLKRKFSLCSGCTIHINDTFDKIFSQNKGKLVRVFSAYDIIKESIIVD